MWGKAKKEQKGIENIMHPDPGISPL